MTDAGSKPWIGDVAGEVIAASRAGRQVPPFSNRYAGFSLADAYEVAQRVRAIRVANGETVIGRKIGFTNQAVWDRHGLSAPVWGYMYDSTVRDLSSGDARFPLAGLAEPRIEPEIVLGLARAPQPGTSDEAVLACVDWIAHGFEIVQSIFPGWAFTPADAVAAQGLHTALLSGQRHFLSPDRRLRGDVLSNFKVELIRNGEVMTSGYGRDVLGGPIHALRFLVEALTHRPASEGLRAGEIVTTGTLTQALLVAPGEIWTTELSGIEIEGLQLHFEG